MTLEGIATHMAARYGSPEKFDDLYQEAWLAICEAQKEGLNDKGIYWHVRNTYHVTTTTRTVWCLYLPVVVSLTC